MPKLGKKWQDFGEVDMEALQSIDVLKDVNEDKRIQDERKKLTAPDLYQEENTYKVSVSVLLCFDLAFVFVLLAFTPPH